LTLILILTYDPREETAMFVCVCNGITEHQVRAAIEEGACSLHDLSARLGVASGCGCCAEFAADLISAARQPDPSALPAGVPA
jgi:bacterioferritin-associated ferredoxin